MLDDYIAMSQPHLSLPISDEQYRSVLAMWTVGGNILSHLTILIRIIA